MYAEGLKSFVGGNAPKNMYQKKGLMETLRRAAKSLGSGSRLYQELQELVREVGVNRRVEDCAMKKAEAMMEKAEAMMKKARAGAGSCGGGGGGGDGDGDGGGGGFTAFLFKCGKLVDEGGKWGEEE